jgi:hypothetical protein
VKEKRKERQTERRKEQTTNKKGGKNCDWKVFRTPYYVFTTTNRLGVSVHPSA